MTALLCQRTCRNKGFTVAGLNNGNNCFCSNTANTGNVYPLAACNSACFGDNTQSCGGGTSMVSIYDTQVPAGLPPAGFPTGYVGCFSDPLNAKQMTGYRLTTASTMNAAICGDMCKSRGFSLAGTENGNQCYCGNALPTTLLVDSKCGSQCSGFTGETCGGLDRLSVYNVSGVQVAASSSGTNTGTGTATRLSSTGVASGTSRLSTSITSSVAGSTVGTTRPATSATSAVATSRASSAVTAATTVRTTVASGTAAASGSTAARTTTGSSTRAPLATGNFIVVDGSTCEANDIGTQSNAEPAARSMDDEAARFVKRRENKPSKFKKVYRRERVSSEGARRHHRRA
jgi:hypothetical protein